MEDSSQGKVDWDTLHSSSRKSRLRKSSMSTFLDSNSRMKSIPTG